MTYIVATEERQSRRLRVIKHILCIGYLYALRCEGVYIYLPLFLILFIKQLELLYSMRLFEGTKTRFQCSKKTFKILSVQQCLLGHYNTRWI